MRLGAPVTALTLSPSMDMLATAHASARGIYLWSNQLLFGGASDILPSQVPQLSGAAFIDAGSVRCMFSRVSMLVVCALASLTWCITCTNAPLPNRCRWTCGCQPWGGRRWKAPSWRMSLVRHQRTRALQTWQTLRCLACQSMQRA